MDKQFQIRSTSFDTSFSVKDNVAIDLVIKAAARDHVTSFVAQTVAAEPEQLKIWGRITESTFKKAKKHWTHTHAAIIDFKNNSCLILQTMHVFIQCKTKESMQACDQ